MNRPNITLSPSTDLPYWIERVGSFEAAHQLDGHPKCGYLHGHSYNYIVIIRSSTIHDETGFVLDFSAISEYFNKFDHSGDVIKVSCEEFTATACDDLLALVPQPNAEVYVFVQETAKSWAGFSKRKGDQPVAPITAVAETSPAVPTIPRGKLTAEAYLGDPA
jgi:hypothetical protein